MKDEFTKSGWHHRIVAKIGRVCIYERKKIDGNALHYEVVVPNVAKSDWRIGQKIVLRAGDASYPSLSEWGLKAWTTHTLERALQIAGKHA